MQRWLAAGAMTLMLATTGMGAACGGSGSGDDDDDGPVTVNNPSVPAGAVVVDQDNLKFRPKELTATAGTPIYFVNSETAIHTVTIGGKNESGTMKRNDVFVWTAPGPGEYQIRCDFHAQMRSTVTVE